jgi:hypothetical protein
LRLPRKFPIPRYPLTIDLEYRLLLRGVVVGTGQGHTVRLSSAVVQFESADYLPLQRRVEICIAWPARLDNGVGLNLWIVGCTVPSEDRSIAVAIQRYEFRTRRELPLRNGGQAKTTEQAVARSA